MYLISGVILEKRLFLTLERSEIVLKLERPWTMLWNTSLRMALHTGLLMALKHSLAFWPYESFEITHLHFHKLFHFIGFFRFFAFPQENLLTGWLTALRILSAKIQNGHTSCLHERLRDLAVFNSCEMTTFVIIFWDEIFYEKIMKFHDFKDKTWGKLLIGSEHWDVNSTLVVVLPSRTTSRTSNHSGMKMEDD